MENKPVLKVPTMAEMMAKGEQPDVLFWVGCAGSFDDRAKKITKAFVKILNHLDYKFAVLEQKSLVVVIRLKEPVTSFYFKCRQWQILR